MRKAFIQQFACTPPPRPSLNSAPTATGTFTFTKEDDDNDDPFCPFVNTKNSWELFGTMTSTANPFEGPEQDTPMPLCGVNEA